MKRLAAVGLLVLVGAAIHAEDTIDIVTREVYTASYGNGAMFGTSWGTWAPYLNGERISEEDFYRITGDEASARAVDNFLKKLRAGK